MDKIQKLADLLNLYHQANLAVSRAQFLIDMTPPDDVEARASMAAKLEETKAGRDKLQPAIDAIAKAAEPYHDFLFGTEKASFVA